MSESTHAGNSGEKHSSTSAETEVTNLSPEIDEISSEEEPLSFPITQPSLAETLMEPPPPPQKDDKGDG